VYGSIACVIEYAVAATAGVAAVTVTAAPTAAVETTMARHRALFMKRLTSGVPPDELRPRLARGTRDVVAGATN
jgi:hypothetical protein